MKFLVVVSCLLAVACAKPGHLAYSVAPLAYSAAPAHSFGYSTSSHHVPFHYAAPVAHAYSAITPVHHAYHPYAYAAVAPIVHHPIAAVEKTQYHAQDILGQASYGHAEAFQSHTAIQDAAGNKIGAFSYVAPNNEVISAKYVADGLGYRVESSAAPVAPIDTPEVAAARAEHLKTFEEVKNRSRRDTLLVAPHAYTHPLVYAHPHAYTHYTPYVARTTAYNTLINTPFSHTHTYAYKHY